MPWYAKYDGVDGSVDAKDGTSNTIMFAERYRSEGGETSSGNRLFVGNLTMDTFEFVPEKRSALDLWAAELGRAVNGGPTENVVELRAS